MVEKSHTENRPEDFPDSSTTPAIGPDVPSAIRDTELLRAVVELTTDAIFVKDLQGKYLLFNRAAGRFVGRSCEDVIGKDDSELFSPESAQIVRRRDRLVIESGQPLIGEEQLVASGVERTYLASKVPLRSSDGTIVGLIGISRDISDRKKSEEQILEHQAFLEAIIRSASEGICVFRQLSPLEPPVFSIWNERMTLLTGFTVEEINQLGWAETLGLSEEDRDTGNLPFLSLYSSIPHSRNVGVIRRRDGAVRILSASVSKVLLESNFSAWVAMVEDVTERRVMERTLHDSDLRFRSFMDNLPGRAWIKDCAGRYVFVNRRMQLEFGKSEQEFIGKTAVELFGEEAETFQRNDRICLDENRPLSVVESVRKNDGSREWSHVSKFPIPAIADSDSLLGGVAFDITHLRRVETALRDSEHRFLWFLRNLPGPAWIKDHNLRYTFANLAFQQETDKSEEDFLGKTDFEIFDEKSAAIYQENDRRALSERRAIDAVETRHQPDGTIHHFHVSKFPIFAEDGMSCFVGGFAVDISEKLKASEERQISEERLRVAQSLAHIGSFFWSIERNELYWSDELYRIYGYEPKSIEPNLDVYLSHIHIDDKDRVMRAVEATITERGRFQHEYRIRTLYNDVRWVMATGRCVCDSDGNVTAIEGTCQDVSERKHLEEQLQHSQKMEAIGLLAGGISHDFNNLLTVITGYSFMLLSQPGLAHPVQESLQAIQDAAHRASALTRQLLTFSRRQSIEPVVLDINQIILGTEHLLQRFVGDRINLELDLAEDIGLVRIDASQVEQILINLAVNARDAMPNGGLLKFVTRNVTDSEIDSRTLRPSVNYVELHVIDNGTGMAEDVRQRVFEPFFTTKDIGKGTGLGLSVVHGIVEQAGGGIRVQSQLTRGTVFRIRLPVVMDSESNVPIEDDEVENVRNVVLLVDDDEPVRRVARVALESQNFVVIEAESADDAMELIDRRETSIDLLVTDVSMPRIRGRELAVKVINKLPQIRVLFISGYANSAGLQEGLSVPNDFLEKPFSPNELISRVRKLVNFVADQRY